MFETIKKAFSALLPEKPTRDDIIEAVSKSVSDLGTEIETTLQEIAEVAKAQATEIENLKKKFSETTETEKTEIEKTESEIESLKKQLADAYKKIEMLDINYNSGGTEQVKTTKSVSDDDLYNRYGGDA